jgi:hypothetical protein
MAIMRIGRKDVRFLDAIEIILIGAAQGIVATNIEDEEEEVGSNAHGKLNEATDAGLISKDSLTIRHAEVSLNKEKLDETLNEESPQNGEYSKGGIHCE